MAEHVPPVELGNSAVTLRAWRVEDVPDQVMGFADPVVQQFSWPVTRPYTESDARQFFAEQEEDRRTGEELNFAIVTPHDPDHVLGGGSLYGISQPTGRAAVGYWLIGAARGNGYATEATRIMSTCAFDTLGVKRLELTCSPDNIASQAVAARCGFVREGLLRSHTPFRAGRRDTVMFSLLPGEMTSS